MCVNYTPSSRFFLMNFGKKSRTRMKRDAKIAPAIARISLTIDSISNLSHSNVLAVYSPVSICIFASLGGEILLC